MNERSRTASAWQAREMIISDGNAGEDGNYSYLDIYNKLTTMAASSNHNWKVDSTVVGSASMRRAPQAPQPADNFQKALVIRIMLFQINRLGYVLCCRSICMPIASRHHHARAFRLPNRLVIRRCTILSVHLSDKSIVIRRPLSLRNCSTVGC